MEQNRLAAIHSNNSNSIVFTHIPVLLHQSIEGLLIQAGQWYIDATVGGGGYTVEILKRGAKVLGIDTDVEAIEAARKNIQQVCSDKKEGHDWKLVHGNFRDIQTIAQEHQQKIFGIVADLGVSSYQLDTPERGFSYRFEDAKLDLRLDQQSGRPASDIVSTYSEEDLYEIFATLGEEERARAIARAVVLTRKMKPIQTTGDLLDAIRTVQSGQHVYDTASRVYQALRMHINDELGSLKLLITGAGHILSEKGRFAVVSFHSLEDRMIKLSFRSHPWHIVTKQPIVADNDEKEFNKRSRSAKLRIAEITKQ